MEMEMVKEKITKKEIMYEPSNLLDIDNRYNLAREDCYKELSKIKRDLDIERCKYLASSFNVNFEEIALSMDELKRGKTKVLSGVCYQDYNKNSEIFESVEAIVNSNICFNSLVDAHGLRNIRYLDGIYHFINLANSTGMNSLAHADALLRFVRLKNARGLNNLSDVESLDFFSLESSAGLENLESITRDACFPNLIDASGLLNLKQIGGNASFYRLPKEQKEELFMRIRKK